MKNKILKMILLLCIAFLFTSTICFASTNEEITSTNIGNEITSSIEATQKTIDNLTGRNADASGEDMKDDAKDVGNTVKDGLENGIDTIKSGAEDAGNTIENGVNHVENTVKDGARDVENGTEDTRNAISGETSNFASRETTNASEDGMSLRTWVWIIIAVIAVIIIAAVWYYAANKNN